MTEFIEISIGELWDKYSILLIKQEKITDPHKRHYIETEINSLNKNMDKYCFDHELFVKLKKINTQLWDIEDNIRIKEKFRKFDHEFIELSRNVYKTNDERCYVKTQINLLYSSSFNEVKDYIKYK